VADGLSIPERSLDNLFAAIRETRRPGRRELIVHSPLENELNAPPNALTRQVRARLAGSGFDILDLYPDVAAVHTKDFYYDGIHLDVVGHRLYADRIAAKLQPLVADPAQDRKTSGLAQ
jgi:lysophospholipase L1-like esterase